MTLLSVFSGLDLSLLSEVLSYDPRSPLIFTSGLFIWLFFLFLTVYIGLSSRERLRIVWVVLFSLFFYYKSSGLAVILLLFATTSDYWIGRAMVLYPDRRRQLVTLSVCINLLILGWFKYFNFLMYLLVGLIRELGFVVGYPAWVELEWTAWDIVLPVGISFYTFQTMSYIIDVSRGVIRPLERWIDYVFYVSFFPQLVAGPIVRARDFIPQIHRKPYLGEAEYAEALLLIMCGLVKKAIISDYISLNFVDRVFDAPALYTGLENLMAVYGYALQIYCDFSGYSDMAIGIALILGFRFNINFDSPYQSASITEFWRRWHISLSSWLKDYLYIPLGGNRKGKWRTYLNLLITMLLGGLWHGAGLNFILWGAIHGVALAVHKLWAELFPQSMLPADALPRGRRWIGRIVTFHLVVLAWIFFRAGSTEEVWLMLGQIWGSFHPEVLWQFVEGYKGVVLLMVLGYLAHFLKPRHMETLRRRLSLMPLWQQVLLFVALIVVVVQLRSGEVQPFIYFQF